MITLTPNRSHLAERDEVVLYPTFAYQIPEDPAAWRLILSGIVSEPGEVNFRKRMMLNLLRRVMKVEPQAFESDIFRQRIRAFLAKTERGKRLTLRVAEKDYRIPKKTRRNGHFRGAMRISDDELRSLQASCECPRQLDVGVVRQSADEIDYTGRVHVVEPTGISVISDIDDTIKHSVVASRGELLANTFLKDFEAVPAMSALYQRWQADEVAFHYVSSSPWQLFDALHDLCLREQFPDGSFHLREFRIRDHMLRPVMLLRRGGKAAVIKGILKAFPQRRFVLVGDSGERDPEIYGFVARRFPGQVERIFIRDLPAKHDAGGST